MTMSQIVGRFYVSLILKKTNKHPENHKELTTLTLLEYIVQFVISSDSIAPRSPKRAPEAPTEIWSMINRDDSTLPPNPDTRYIIPILTDMNLTKESVRFRSIYYVNIDQKRN